MTSSAIIAHCHVCGATVSEDQGVARVSFDGVGRSLECCNLCGPVLRALDAASTEVDVLADALADRSGFDHLSLVGPPGTDAAIRRLKKTTKALALLRAAREVLSA